MRLYAVSRSFKMCLLCRMQDSLAQRCLKEVKFEHVPHSGKAWRALRQLGDRVANALNMPSYELGENPQPHILAIPPSGLDLFSSNVTARCSSVTISVPSTSWGNAATTSATIKYLKLVSLKWRQEIAQRRDSAHFSRRTKQRIAELNEGNGCFQCGGGAPDICHVISRRDSSVYHAHCQAHATHFHIPTIFS